MNKVVKMLMVCGLLLSVTMLVQTASAVPGNLILQVPDWNQPGTWPAPGYPLWCSPTAGGNIMGYWEDVMNCKGLADQQAYNASPIYPGTQGTWEQGLSHDGIIEMGWFMNTGNWQNQGPPPNFPPAAGMTNLANILPGLLGYAMGSWTDNDYPPGAPAPGTGIVKKAYPNATGFTHNKGNIGMAAMWATYCAEIDAAHPAEISFDKWVDTSIFNGTMTIDTFPGQQCEMYPWDLTTDAHSVVGVGYIDINPAVFMNNGTDEWFVCQDNWPGPGGGAGGTGRYVAVPMDTFWQQNDYITDVPEPACLALMTVGGLLAICRRRRARR